MTDDITQWLEGLGLGQYAQAFVENRIELDILPSLSDDDLKELGLKLGDRRRVQRAISSDEPAHAAPAIEPTALSSEAERRQLTVMFCDLVGSTALSSQLDPEDMREVIRAYQDACAGVVTRYEGFVAKYMGDGVLVYFGYPTAHEDDAERAINAGLGIVEAVQGLERDLQVRIGIATGMVVVGDIVGEGASQEAAITGETPNLAARLQEIADPDSVVIAATTHTLAGGLFECVDNGVQVLKGFSDPVRVWSVSRVRRAESRFDATRAEHLTDLIGREEEMEILQRRWDRAKSGEGQVVLISGEPGIGKSRLVRELQERITDADDAHVRLRHQCSPYHTNSALHPIIEQLEHAARFETGDSAEAKLDKLESLLSMSGQAVENTASLLGSLLSLPTDGRYPPLSVSPQQRKELTLQALVDQLSGLSELEPVLFVFEDAHWIDPTSLELLELTVERVPEIAALMLITYRPEFVTPWIGRPRVTPLILSRLERRDCALMVERLAGQESFPENLLDRITIQTDGVPLFVEELTKSVLESSQGSESIQVDLVPVTLQDSLEARLDRLGSAKEIAQVGSVIGREFPYELLRIAAELDDDGLVDGLNRLVQSELLYARGQPPNSTYSFKHALIQDTAYSSLLRGRRRELHSNIAAALEAQFPEVVRSEPERLGRHHLEAGNPARAAENFLTAGKSSMARGAISEADRQLSAGLEAIENLANGSDPPLELEFELLTALSVPISLNIVAGLERLESTYRRMREICQVLGDHRREIFALYGLSAVYTWSARFDKAVGEAENLVQIANAIGDPDQQLAGHNALGYSLWFTGENRRSLDHLQAVIDQYDPKLYGATGQQYLGGWDLGVVSHCYAGLGQYSLGRPNAARKTLEAGLKIARDLGGIPSLCYALMINAILATMLRDVGTAKSMADECLQLSEEHGMRSFQHPMGHVLGWHEFKTGDSRSGASQIAHHFEAWKNSGVRFWTPYYASLVADTLAIVDDSDDRITWVEAELDDIIRTGQRQFLPNLLTMRGRSVECGSSLLAESSYREAIEVARAQSAKSWELRAATQLARLWHMQGKSTEARDLLAPVYGCFTEGFDTSDLKEAKALLDELS